MIGKKSNSGRLHLPLTVCPGAIREKHLAFLFIERVPDLAPFVLSPSRKVTKQRSLSINNTSKI